ncbi:hypothetical protein [Amycolatopsis sp. cmx-11-12]
MGLPTLVMPHAALAVRGQRGSQRAVTGGFHLGGLALLAVRS